MIDFAPMHDYHTLGSMFGMFWYFVSLEFPQGFVVDILDTFCIFYGGAS